MCPPHGEIDQPLQRATDDDARWDAIEAGVGTLAESDHDWDADPAQWVAEQRVSNAERT